MFNDRYGLTKAILEGRKTQTRRVITCPTEFKGQYVAGFNVYKRASDGFVSEICMYDADERAFDGGQILPRYKVGEIVAVAQSYKDCGGFMDDGTPRWDYISRIVGNKSGGWTNKMFVKPELMPHQIRITNIRVERLQDISDEDCLAEGITEPNKDFPWYSFGSKSFMFNEPKQAYVALIDKISGKGSWERNPWVWVYEFELVK